MLETRVRSVYDRRVILGSDASSRPLVQQQRARSRVARIMFRHLLDRVRIFIGVWLQLNQGNSLAVSAAVQSSRVRVLAALQTVKAAAAWFLPGQAVSVVDIR